MTTPRFSPWQRAVALLLTLMLFAAACGSDEPDDSAADEEETTEPAEEEEAEPAEEEEAEPAEEQEAEPAEGEDAEPVEGEAESVQAGGSGDRERLTEKCAAGVDESTPAGAALARACAMPLDESILGRLLVETCVDERLNPRFYFEFDVEPSDESSAEPETVVVLLFFFHMMVRFHPVDVLDPSGTGFEPASAFLPPAPQLGIGDSQVWVIDTGTHGQFVSQIIDEMLGSSPASVSAFELTRQGDVPVSPFMNVDLSSLALDSDGAVLVTDELSVAEVLRAILVREDVDHSKLVVNMSFGAYNCGEEPSELAPAIRDLVDAGATLVASAGNDETAEPIWPAAFPEVISVGSHVTGDPDTRSCFSNFAAYVDYWVPGEEVQTSMGTWSGTSFAAPQVTAMMAGGNNGAAASSSAPQNVDGGGAMSTVTVTLDDGSTLDLMTFCDPSGEYAPRNTGN